MVLTDTMSSSALYAPDPREIEGKMLSSWAIFCGEAARAPCLMPAVLKTMGMLLIVQLLKVADDKGLLHVKQ